MYNRAVRKALPLLLLLPLAACKQGPRPAPSLQKTFDTVSRSPACAQNLPMEWVSSWPVPADKEGRFQVLFYSLDRASTDKDGLPRIRPTAPRGRAVFSADGKVLECKASGDSPRVLDGERYPPAAMDLDEEAFDAAVAKLLDLTAKAAAAFAKDAKDPGLAGEFGKQFRLLGEPALRPFYYQANPGFWEWLRREGGASLPAPK